MYSKKGGKLTFFWHTSFEWIAGKAGGTATDRIVIDYRTTSVKTARTRTRIQARLLDTSLIHCTFRANSTFWTASRWRTNVIGLTRTDGMFVHIAALAVRATGRRTTWIDRSVFDFYSAEEEGGTNDNEH